MAEEIRDLEQQLKEQAAQIDALQAENQRLHQRRFKARRKAADKPKPAAHSDAAAAGKKKKRGAPKGHPPWNRKEPDRIDQTRHASAPCHCPHCQTPTDLTQTDQTSYVQEDIVLRPQTVVTEYRHASAWCPNC